MMDYLEELWQTVTAEGDGEGGAEDLWRKLKQVSGIQETRGMAEQTGDGQTETGPVPGRAVGNTPGNAPGGAAGNAEEKAGNTAEQATWAQWQQRVRADIAGVDAGKGHLGGTAETLYETAAREHHMAGLLERKPVTPAAGEFAPQQGRAVTAGQTGTLAQRDALLVRIDRAAERDARRYDSGFALF